MKIAIIEKTDEHIDFNKHNIREQIEDIILDPSLLYYKDVNDQNDVHQIISSTLTKHNADNNTKISAVNIYETINVLIAAYFIDHEQFINIPSNNDNVNDNDKNMNKNKNNTNDVDNIDIKQIINKTNKKGIKIDLNEFGVQLTSHSVSNKMVLVKYKLRYKISGKHNNNVQTITDLCDLQHHELLNAIECIFNKTGIRLNENGDMEEYKYITNPLEPLIKIDNNFKQNYIYHEYEIYTRVIMIFVDKRNDNDNSSINVNASMLCQIPIYGNAVVGMYKKPEYTESPPYVSLSLSRFKNILNIRKRGAHLTTGFEKNSINYVNYDKLISLELNKHSNKKIIPIDNIINNNPHISTNDYDDPT